MLITTLANAASQGDGDAVVKCFTPLGIYHDCFYGSFQGIAIKDMIENFFHRDAENFLWDMHNLVENGAIGYARYVFSYDSKLSQSRGTRAVFEGVSICRLKDGLIDEYREVAGSIAGLQQLGFNDARLSRLIRREATALRERDEVAHHLMR
ncbi:MAG: nuclear transport factor 2 family protein [Proteobacteria bacterium]|nr:nuclear transport factor 2 family protein [Pseudomonadota bacterium]